ncbi:metallophosphoesterase [Mesorhizobium sp. B283B1A]|uniref:metallophosphoesterase family protein n=1 Tax=Mesorhizobium TaxID=68287 RepID=UPI001CD14900|nr:MULTISPECIES: metallophosphoesterase [Mesorhizobium]MCA0050647.1 metallophosphoesterase [Mesorhizobium sp. B283B1A]UQS66921.1 metallophosphoesterase [Mesorhizobium opportunistum]
MTRRVVALMVSTMLSALSVISPTRSQEPEKIGMLLAAGDISWCPGEGWTRAKATGDIIRDVIKQAKVPVRVLALGDLAYRHGEKSQLECFTKNWAGFDDVLLPIPGNHEYDTKDAAPFFSHFKDNQFVHQNDDPEPNEGHKGENPRWDKKGYFSLDFPRQDGPWLIVGLNDNFQEPAYKQDMAAQMKWMDKRLDSSALGGKTCILAFWHAPLFSSGQHGHEGYSHPKAEAPLSHERPMQAIFRALYEHGASVVLSGHDHDYEQFAPHDADGKPAADGIRSFVVGTGGSRLTKDFYKKPFAATSEGGPFGNVKGNQGVLKIDLYEDYYTWEFLQIASNGPKKDIPALPTRQNCNKPR